MKSKQTTNFSILVLVTMFAASSALEADELYDWTSTGGTTIKAEFMRMQGGEVTLLRDNGKQIVIALEKLDAKSRRRAERLAEIAESDPEAAPADERFQVALFEDGPWKGFHAVYEREKFFAVADRTGQVRIYMKKDGKRIPGAPPCILRLTPHYHVSVIEGRKLVHVETDGKPTTDPKKLTFSGKTQAGTTFQVTYLFEGDGVEAYGFLRDRGKVEHPTRLHVGVRFLKNNKITPEMSVEEQNAVVGDSWIKALSRDGDELEFDYVTEVGFRKHEQLVRGLESATIKHAASGPHLVKVYPPEREHGRLSLWNASTIAPHAGYSVPLYREDTGDRSARAKVRVEIE